MRMTRYDHIDSGRHRIEVKLLEVVKHIDGPATELHEGSVRVSSRPPTSIDVSSYCRYWCDLAEFREHLKAADITGMDDVMDARESFGRLRAQKTMRIRNDADPHRRSPAFRMLRPAIAPTNRPARGRGSTA